MAEHMIKWFHCLTDEQLLPIILAESMRTQGSPELARDLLVVLGARLKAQVAGEIDPVSDSGRAWPDPPTRADGV